jgi:hypothetical protein
MAPVISKAATTSRETAQTFTFIFNSATSLIYGFRHYSTNFFFPQAGKLRFSL